MKFKTLILGLACPLIVILIASFGFSQNTVSTSNVRYASLLKEYFPEGIRIHGDKYPLNTIPCLPVDITRFEDVIAEKTDTEVGPAFQVKGTLHLWEIVEPFIVPWAGKRGRLYMLYLQAYLFSPNGMMIWQQQELPIGYPWVSARGGKEKFRLVGAFNRSTRGCALLIIAIGDPIIFNDEEKPVILGVKKIDLQ